MKPKLQLAALTEKGGTVLQKARRYTLVMFMVFVIGIYGFVLFRINTLSNAQPSADAVNSQVKAARIPHIDPSVVSKLQSLQDNSVSVKSLFNQARDNPFQ